MKKMSKSTTGCHETVIGQQANQNFRQPGLEIAE
jgi:hypothetical protein